MAMSSNPIPFRVKVDRDRCQTAATCLAFPVYELDDEAKAVLLTRNGQNSDTPKNQLVDCEGYVNIQDLINPQALDGQAFNSMVLESAQACPFNAIIVLDQKGDQVWPPA